MAMQSVGGLISGLDTANIIEQLMAYESRPVKLLEQRITEHQTTLEAYRGVNNLLLEYQSSVSALADSALWNTHAAASSNSSILAASAGQHVQEGSYTFRVGRLAQSAQYMSAGFADRLDSAISPAAGGTVRIDSGKTALARATDLAVLNGDDGVYHGKIRLTDRAGNTEVVDLTTAETLSEAINLINSAGNVLVRAEVSANGDGLTLTDLSGGAGSLSVQDFGGGTTATDLGIAKSVAGATLTGDSVNFISGRTSLARLRDGLGVNNSVPYTIRIQDATSDFTIDLSDASTVQDVIDLINGAAGNTSITAGISASGKGFRLDGDALIQVSNDGAGHTTAEDLGFTGGGFGTLEGVDLIGALNSVRVANLTGVDPASGGVNGAQAAPTSDLGSIRIDNAGTGGTVIIDLTLLTGASSLSDVIREFNSAAAGDISSAGLSLRINDTGNGLELVNATGEEITVSNDVGTTAENLGLTGVLADGESRDGGDLDLHYISRATALSSLNNGRGVAKGSFRLYDSSGGVIDLDISTDTTVGDVVDRINGLGMAVTASVNATGDGILLTGNAGNDIQVEELFGGSTAADLNILGTGTGAPGTSVIDGSFETVLSVDTDDTLSDLADRISDANDRLQVSIIHDGSAYAPYRLVVKSRDSGEAGDFLIDANIASLDMEKTLSGRDAVLLYGQEGSSAGPVLLSSSTNTNTSAVLGLSLNLRQASSEYVTVSVERDTDSITEAAQDMVGNYNILRDLVGELDKWDPENESGGILFGDASIRTLMRDINDQWFHQLEGVTGGYRTLFDIGFGFDDDGRATFEATTFSRLLQDNFEGVEELLVRSRDIARSDLGASVTASLAAGGGTSAANLLNGNTESEDFGAANGWESAAAISSTNPAVFTVAFAETQILEQIVLHHIDSVAMPAKEYALRDFNVEYQDTSGNWQQLRQVRGNLLDQTFIGFGEPTEVRGFRITATNTNAADGLGRLVEIEAKGTEGALSLMERNARQKTDSVSGFFAQRRDLIDTKITDIETSINQMEARLEEVEEKYIRQFTAMEAQLAQMQAQSDFFLEQMDAWKAGQND